MLEDMLWGCVLDFPGSWDKYIPLMEFSYYNSYQSSMVWPPMKLCMAGNIELLYVG